MIFLGVEPFIISITTTPPQAKMARFPFRSSRLSPPPLLHPHPLPIAQPPRRERIGLTEREWAMHRTRLGLPGTRGQGSTCRLREPRSPGCEPRGAQASRVQSVVNCDGSVTWFYWVRELIVRAVSLGYRRRIYFGREVEVLRESLLLAFWCAAILVVLELRPVRGRREEAVFVKNVQHGKPSQISGLLYRCGAAPHLVASSISPSVH